MFELDLNFFTKMILRAKSNVKKIVLPETEDDRILLAAGEVLEKGFANIILLGNKENIALREKELNIDLTGAEIIDPEESEYMQNLVIEFANLRAHKGMTIEKAREVLKDKVYFGMMLLYMGICDGLVAGAIHTTKDVLRPVLQIIKTDSDSKIVSSFFVMDTKQETYGSKIMVFADCALNIDPDENELSEIAVNAGKNYELFVTEEPRVALLSYSTNGSGESESVTKVKSATNLAKILEPKMLIEGELQLDAAIVPEVAQLKTPDSILQGRANVLVFPDLNSGNIGYKLVQRLGGAEAYGPILQGTRKAVNDISRGANVKDIVGTIAITCVQAQEKALNN